VDLFRVHISALTTGNIVDPVFPSVVRLAQHGESHSTVSSRAIIQKILRYVSEKGAYHHGEKSLEDAIVNMAQDFVGSNNLNLLCPSGQFGTRLAGGHDHASARYLWAFLAALS